MHFQDHIESIYFKGYSPPLLMENSINFFLTFPYKSWSELLYNSVLESTLAHPSPGTVNIVTKFALQITWSHTHRVQKKEVWSVMVSGVSLSLLFLPNYLHFSEQNWSICDHCPDYCSILITKNNWGFFLQNFLVKIDPALTLYHKGFIQIQLNSQKFCQFKIYKNVY